MAATRVKPGHKLRATIHALRCCIGQKAWMVGSRPSPGHASPTMTIKANASSDECPNLPAVCCSVGCCGIFGRLGLVGDRRQIADGGMTTGWVVPALDEAED